MQSNNIAIDKKPKIKKRYTKKMIRDMLTDKNNEQICLMNKNRIRPIDIANSLNLDYSKTYRISKQALGRKRGRPRKINVALVNEIKEVLEDSEYWNGRVNQISNNIKHRTNSLR
jgi:hypothetical protein